MSFPPLATAVYLGGVLTIFSPCILPVLPFVFASAGRPFARWTGPMLGVLVVAFVAVAAAGTAGAAWVAEAADYGRWAALALLAVAGVMLLSTRVAAVVTRPPAHARRGHHGARLYLVLACRPGGLGHGAPRAQRYGEPVRLLRHRPEASAGGRGYKALIEEFRGASVVPNGSFLTLM